MAPTFAALCPGTRRRETAASCGSSSARWRGRPRPCTTYTPPLLGAEAVLHAGGRLELDLDPSFEHGILLDTGEVSVDGTPMAVDHLHYLRPGRSQGRRWRPGRPPARVLILGGEPLGEQIVMWWNFVGRTHEEVVAYRAAWQAEIGAEPADAPAGDTYPDGAPFPRFGPFPEGYPAPLPAPALPNARLRPRG